MTMITDESNTVEVVPCLANVSQNGGRDFELKDATITFTDGQKGLKLGAASNSSQLA